MERLASLKSWDNDPQRIPTWDAAIQRSGHSDKIIHQAFQDYLTYGIKHPALKYVTNTFAEPWHIVTIAEHLSMKHEEDCIAREQQESAQYKRLPPSEALSGILSVVPKKSFEGTDEKRLKKNLAEEAIARRRQAEHLYCMGIETEELERVGKEKIQQLTAEEK